MEQYRNSYVKIIGLEYWQRDADFYYFNLPNCRISDIKCMYHEIHRKKNPFSHVDY